MAHEFSNGVRVSSGVRVFKWHTSFLMRYTKLRCEVSVYAKLICDAYVVCKVDMRSFCGMRS